VTVRGVTVTSQGPNDDGCDPECSSDVLIEGCHFDTRDDCIAIKSGRGRDGLRRGTPSRNIVIRDCRMSRGGHAVAIGSEEAAGVSDVYVDGLTGDDARLFGGVLVKAQSFYGAGTVERVHVRNVRLAGVQNAAIAMTYYYGGTPEKGPYRPTFRDLSFTGFTCGRSRNALNLDGFPDHPIGPVQVSDSAFGGVSGQGVAARNVTGLRLTNVRVNGKPVGG
jgi:polygalacturonase